MVRSRTFCKFVWRQRDKRVTKRLVTCQIFCKFVSRDKGIKRVTMPTTQTTTPDVENIVHKLKTEGSYAVRQQNYADFHVQFNIRRGEGAKMFTLWLATPTDEGFWQEIYLNILSNNFEKAARKAAQAAINHPAVQNGNNRVVIQVYSNVVNERAQEKDSTVFPFGKYKNKRFDQVEDNSYKEWLLDILAQKPGHTKAYKNLRQNMLDSGFVEEEGKLLSPERIQKREEQKQEQEQRQNFWENLRQNSAYIDAQIGAKLGFFKAQLIGETSFDTAFGKLFIQTFVDEQNRVFIYKGNNPVIEEDKGVPFYVRGTVKGFNTYNDIKQTRLSNLVVLDTGAKGLCLETFIRRANQDGYANMQEALNGPIVDEQIEYVRTYCGNIAKKDMKFAKQALIELFSCKTLN